MVSTSWPMGLMQPMPVMTTRLLMTLPISQIRLYYPARAVERLFRGQKSRRNVERRTIWLVADIVQLEHSQQAQQLRRLEQLQPLEAAVEQGEHQFGLGL